MLHDVDVWASQSVPPHEVGLRLGRRIERYLKPVEDFRVSNPVLRTRKFARTARPETPARLGYLKTHPSVVSFLSEFHTITDSIVYNQAIWQLLRKSSA
jgi:hypothetical protein